jgi:hypothetical protein
MPLIHAQIAQHKRISEIIKMKEAELRTLRKERTLLMDSIQDYLLQRNLPCARCGDVAIYRQEKTKRVTGRKTEEKEDDGIAVLRSYGISNPRELFAKIQAAVKGPEIQDSKLVIESVDAYKKKQKKKQKKA